MGVEKLFGKGNYFDALDHLNKLDVSKEAEFAGADSWVVFHSLQDEKDSALVTENLRKGNVVLLDTEYLSHNGKDKLEKIVDSLKDSASRLDGDIARISSDKILVTPRGMKIMRKRLA